MSIYQILKPSMFSKWLFDAHCSRFEILSGKFVSKVYFVISLRWAIGRRPAGIQEGIQFSCWCSSHCFGYSHCLLRLALSTRSTLFCNLGTAACVASLIFYIFTELRWHSILSIKRFHLKFCGQLLATRDNIAYSFRHHDLVYQSSYKYVVNPPAACFVVPSSPCLDDWLEGYIVEYALSIQESC